MRTDSRGFTLLETLIALTLSICILAILSSMVYSLAMLQQRSKDSGNADVYGDYLRFRRIIRGIIAPGLQGVPSFSVTSEPRLTMSAWFARAGVNSSDGCRDLAGLYLEHSPETGLEIEIFDDFSGNTTPDHFVLFKGASGFQLELTDKDGNLHTGWDSRKNILMPESMKLIIEYNYDGSVSRREFFIPLPEEV